MTNKQVRAGRIGDAIMIALCCAAVAAVMFFAVWLEGRVLDADSNLESNYHVTEVR